MERSKIIAVDFDGTLCVNKYPDIGDSNLELISRLLRAQDHGATLILYTMREGKHLDAAVEWCKTYGLFFDAVNTNAPEMQKLVKSNPRKVYADIYIDDHNADQYIMHDCHVPYTEDTKSQSWLDSRWWD